MVFKRWLSAIIFFVSAGLIFTGCAPKNGTPVDEHTPEPGGSHATISAPDGELLSSIATTAEPTPFKPEPATRSPSSTTAILPPTPLPANTFTATLALSANSWMELPVIPTIDPFVQEIYQRGHELGNNPRAFSKVGDCGSTPAWFLGDFDNGPKYYRLGEHTYLIPVIQEFQGSFGRTSVAAKSGFNASSIFTSLWANREHCTANETPLACEFRLHQPAFAFIMLGSNDVYHQDTFEAMLRQIIEYAINKGVIPILSTKADNLEGDGSINATIARLADEYRLPLLNYWLAIQPLPDHGLQEDGVHITWGPNRFDDSRVMQRGWTVRNLTALQILDAVWRKATGQVNTINYASYTRK